MAASPSTLQPVQPAGCGQRRDLAAARIPLYALAVLDALRFDAADNSGLSALPDADYRRLLAFCDRAQLTLTLGHACGRVLPDWIQARLGNDLRHYAVRFQRLKESLFEAAGMLEARGIEFVVLKGIAHSPDFTPDPRLRAQGDIDIWCRPEDIQSARKGLEALGYRTAGTSPGIHLPPLIRDRDWEWRGDYFAPDLPIPVELHYQLWDEEFEYIPAPGLERFWDRRGAASVDGRRLPVLFKPDALAFASLHLLKHMLHGDLRLQRAWELASFLHSHAHRNAFWSVWQRCHSQPLRRLEAIVFRLVSDWFGSALAEAPAQEVESLPEDVKLWIDLKGLSPLEALFRPNKDELWLQLLLVESAWDRWRVFRRRLAPLRRPALWAEGAGRRASGAPRHWERYASFVLSRAAHHARALFPSLVSGAGWYWRRMRLETGFLQFQAASVLFSFGMFIFFLLYNLYLLGLGFREDLIGRVAGVLSLGTVLGALCAAWVTRRAGLRNTLLIAIVGAAAGALFRILGSTEAWLLGAAGVHGLFLAFWAVSFSPAVAGLTSADNRQAAFGVACSLGVSAGVLGGLAGGHLPGQLRSWLHMSGTVAAQRSALLVASAIALSAAIPAAGLRFRPETAVSGRIYPRSRFLAGFLLSLICWSAAMSAFNPLISVFFAQRVRMSVERIGLVQSASQLAQVLSMLLSAPVLKWLGRVRGIACMQAATAAMMALLAVSPAAGFAAACYMGFTSFQYMSEPGLFGLLMSRVPQGERSGSSALYFLTTSLVASVSTTVAGSMALRLGYPSLLLAAAFVAGTAAVLFRALIHEQAPTVTPAAPF